MQKLLVIRECLTTHGLVLKLCDRQHFMRHQWHIRVWAEEDPGRLLWPAVFEHWLRSALWLLKTPVNCALHVVCNYKWVLSHSHCGSAAAEEAARSAASKQARGWQTAQPSPEDLLPEPDLVALSLTTLKQLLLEAATLGCVLWESEKAVQDTGYALQQRHMQPADTAAS